MRNFGDAVSALGKDEQLTVTFAELEGWFPLDDLHGDMTRYISSGKSVVIVKVDEANQTAVVMAYRAY